MTRRSSRAPDSPALPTVVDVESWLDRLYVATDGASLRLDDRRKAVEVTAVLHEIALASARHSRRLPLLLVDAAAGKSYVGLLAAKLLLEPDGRDARVVTIEREGARVASSRDAVTRLASTVPIECREADVGDASAWPSSPSIVVALHACGPAADAVIARSVESRARTLLLVPCCTGRGVEAATRAEAAADRRGVPRQAPVRRRFVQAMVDAERTWALEAAGYLVEVVEFVAPTVTPHNLLWRAHFVGEAGRMRAARTALDHLHGW